MFDAWERLQGPQAGPWGGHYGAIRLPSTIFVISSRLSFARDCEGRERERENILCSLLDNPLWVVSFLFCGETVLVSLPDWTGSFALFSSKLASNGPDCGLCLLRGRELQLKVWLHYGIFVLGFFLLMFREVASRNSARWTWGMKPLPRCFLACRWWLEAKW